MTRLTTSVIALATFAGLGAASAQAVRTATIQPGKPARIHVVTFLKKDCSQGTEGSIRVVTPPKNGNTSVRTGKLKTPASFRCPNVETQAQQLIYEPRKDFQGSDEVTFEIKDADGTTATETLKINVTAKPGAPAKKGSGGVVDL
jgi:hypothetical protein